MNNLLLIMDLAMNGWKRRRLLCYLGLGMTAAGSAQGLGSIVQAKMGNTNNTGKPGSPMTLKSPVQSEAIALADQKLPEFQGINHWFNTEPLTVSQLRGNVVLVQFWTLGCINCQRTLPYIVQWHQQYAAQGLKVIGIHTPEFAYERDLKNIQKAMAEHRITYPVPVDSGFKTWQAYANQYWPHLFLADRQGLIRYDHIGEGAYNTTEQRIRQLLG